MTSRPLTAGQRKQTIVHRHHHLLHFSVMLGAAGTVLDQARYHLTAPRHIVMGIQRNPSSIKTGPEWTFPMLSSILLLI
jgi:hypothetical protein